MSDICGDCGSEECKCNHNKIGKKSNKIKIKPLEFVITHPDSGEIEFLPQTGEILKEVFDPKLPIVVLVVGGLLGQGKSTWLNTLIYRFIRDENLDWQKILMSNSC